MATSLTSRIVDIRPWTLPKAVMVGDEVVTWEMQPLPMEVHPYVTAKGEVGEARARLKQLRQSFLWARGHPEIAPPELRSELIARRTELLAELTEARRTNLGKRVAMADGFRSRAAVSAIRDPKSETHRRLSARDESRIRQVAAARDDEERRQRVRALFLESGVLAPAGYLPARSAPLSLVLSLARSFTATQDVVDALSRDSLNREIVIDAARALAMLDRVRVGRVQEPGRIACEEQGERLREASGMCYGLLYPRDYLRRYGRVVDHAREVISRTATVWLRLFFSPVAASWQGDRLAITTDAEGLGAALAMALLRQPGASQERFTCQGCDVRFEYRQGERVARRDAPVFCPRCRKNGTSAARSARREAVVQRIQTRLGWGWDTDRIRAALADRLGDGDSFGELLERARTRPKRR